MDYSTLLIWVSTIWVFIQLVQLARKRSRTIIKLPPGPAPLPVVSNLFKLGGKPHESLAELAQTYGAVMSLRLGSITTVVVSSASMAKEVLQKQDRALSGRIVPDSHHVLNYNNISLGWSQPNQHWRKLRAMSNTQMFTNQRLDSGQDLRRLKVRELVTTVSEKSAAGEAVDVGRAAFVATINLISSTIFSSDVVDDLDSGSADEFHQLVWGFMEESGRPNAVDYFPLLRGLDPQGVRRRMAEYLKRGFEIIDNMIDRRVLGTTGGGGGGGGESSTGGNDFLHMLLDQSSELSREQVKGLIWELFAGGSETSSSTLEWALAELLLNPKAMAKARSELTVAIGKGREVEESDMAKLPYLQAVVKETLRFHPPGPLMLPHKALANVEIGGFIVPKGSQVLVNVWAIGRDPDIWENPTVFEPERFLGSKYDYKGHDFEFIPFGSGRRICPGLPLASRIVHLMLASLVHTFAWKLPNGMAPQDMDMSNKIGIAIRKQIPLRAIPVQD